MPLSPVSTTLLKSAPVVGRGRGPQQTRGAFISSNNTTIPNQRTCKHGWRDLSSSSRRANNERPNLTRFPGGRLSQQANDQHSGTRSRSSYAGGRLGEHYEEQPAGSAAAPETRSEEHTS